MSEILLIFALVVVFWGLYTGDHRYVTNHLVHSIFPKNTADKITAWFRSLP